MNGYFQMIVAEKGTAIRLYAPTNGGKPIDILEVKRYLDGKAIEYDLLALNEAIKAGQDKTLILNQKKEYPISEMVNIQISQDKMCAIGRFYPPSNDGRLLDKEGIMSALRLEGVRFGIVEENIDRFLNKRKYCRSLVLAKGIPVRHGSDAEITYHFNTDQKARPAVKEDGSVDFFNLGIIEEVQEGKVLATLKPADKGEPGTNVNGENLRPKDVKNLTLKGGNNLKLSEDGLQVIAMTNGQVKLAGGNIVLDNVLRLKEVGTATGNVEFAGSIEITENVASNFTVKAEGNVTVKGIVESAVIEAGGDIIIASGMKGMGKGELKAGGNIVVKFLENTKCTAGGYINADAIIQSRVSASKEITVGGKKGYISGGFAMAGNKIEAKSLGSDMGTTTELEVGIDPSIKKRLAEIQKQMSDAQKNMKKTAPLIEAFNEKMKSGIKLQTEQIKYMQQVILDNKESQRILEEGFDEMCQLEEVVSEAEDACIIVTGDAFAGVKMTISGATMTLKKPCKYTRFVKEGADIKLSAI